MGRILLISKPTSASGNMKICIIVLTLISAAMSRKVPTCGCPKAPPICASNDQTYQGICRMFCHHLYLYKHTHKVHDGPCKQSLFGYDYIDTFWQPSRTNKLFVDLIVV